MDSWTSQLALISLQLILKTTTGVVGINVVAEMLHLEDPIWDESVALKNRKQYLEVMAH